MTRGEATAAKSLAAAIETKEGASELRALFTTLDTDKNGKVSSKEWGRAVSKNRKVLAKYYGGASVAEIGKHFKRLDLDNSDDLTWEEVGEHAAAHAEHLRHCVHRCVLTVVPLHSVAV